MEALGSYTGAQVDVEQPVPDLGSVADSFFSLPFLSLG